MTSIDTRTSVASCYGRLKDEITRDVIPIHAFTATIADSAAALYKEDGYFVFADIAPPAAMRDVVVSAPTYRTRTFSELLPTGAPVQLVYPGEDELFVIAKTVDLATKKVTFDPIAFLPTVPTQAPVVGEGVFATTLAQAIEGDAVSSATLTSVAGLAANTVLRIVRSRHLILRPGAGYAYSTAQTVAALNITAAADGRALPGITAQLDQVNGAVVSTVAVGSVQISQVTIAGNRALLGPPDAVRVVANDRGRCVFYLAAALPIANVRFTVSGPGFVTQTVTLAITPGTQQSGSVSLVAV